MLLHRLVHARPHILHINQKPTCYIQDVGKEQQFLLMSIVTLFHEQILSKARVYIEQYL